MLYLNYNLPFTFITNKPHLTLTSVVFEFVEYNNTFSILINLTLTSVVFESDIAHYWSFILSI